MGFRDLMALARPGYENDRTGTGPQSIVDAREGDQGKNFLAMFQINFLPKLGGETHQLAAREFPRPLLNRFCPFFCAIWSWNMAAAGWRSQPVRIFAQSAGK